MLDRNYLEEFNSPIRQIAGKAELFTSSASSSSSYVSLENVAGAVNVKVASKNIADIDYISATTNGKELTNEPSYGTTLSTTDFTDSVTITQTKYPNTEIQSSYTNGYFTIWLKEHLPLNQLYTISFDMEILSNPLNTNQIFAFFQGIGTGNYRFYYVNEGSKPFEIGKKYRVVGVCEYCIDETRQDRKFLEIRNYGMSLVISNYQIEKGNTATAYTPYIPVEGSRKEEALYIVGLDDNGWDYDFISGSGDYTVESVEDGIAWDRGYVYFTDGSSFCDCWWDMYLDYIPSIGDVIRYDEEENCIYLIKYDIEQGLVGSSITVGSANLFNDNKEFSGNYTYDIINGEKVFYNHADYQREYFCFNINDIWDLADRLGANLTISFDIKTATAGKVLFYTLGARTLQFTTDRNIDCNTDWKRFSFTVTPLYSVSYEASNGTNCMLSFYGTYDTGVIPYIKNLQIELGDKESAYGLYQEPTEYTIDESLSAKVATYAPSTIIYSNTSGIIIDSAEYKMLNKEYKHDGNLKNIKIDRVGDNGKFFGFGIAQKATINILDTNRESNIVKDDLFNISFKLNNNEFVNTYPSFYVAEATRNENTNELTVTAEDLIYKAASNTVAELGLSTDKTIRDFAAAIASFYGLILDIKYFGDISCFDAAGANFEGTETLREVLNAVAEATQTIYYISGNKLIFKQLKKEAAADLAIEKQHYFSLDSQEPVVLGAVCHATELGDNVISSSIGGVTQYVRNNPFWELKENIGELVDAAAREAQGLAITPYSCSWRGNFLAEIGDKLLITAKDNSTISTYLLNDSINYTGGYSQNSTWESVESNETATNPSSLGEKLKQTFARVDKVNQQVEIVAISAEANKEQLSSLQLNTKSIGATVSQIKKDLANNGEAISTLSSKVEAQITAQDVTLSIEKALENGVDKVETTIGKFDSAGLTISKSTSEISTQITEDGMNISRSGEEVLTANNEGVKAQDLHATTFLIIGNNSRFEDYGNRTACFWIGGNN